MTPFDYLRELTYPGRSTSTLIALVTFLVLFALSAAAGPIGLWLAVMVVPAFFRYLVMVAAARARGIDAEPPGIEYFSMAGNLWTLFPALPVFVFGNAWVYLNNNVGQAEAVLFSLFAAAILPAMMAVLVITHSPLQSLNPVALYRLIRETGASYWWAPLTLLLFLALPFFHGIVPIVLVIIIELYLLVAFYAVTGAITRSKNLIDEVDFYDPLEPDPDKEIADLEKERNFILNHAYGLVSRGNREGGLSHIFAWLQKDPYPDAAWGWFFDGMLRWENNESALYFGQQYLSRLLSADDPLRANKVILRCQLVNERFRPLPEDLPAAIAAAEGGGNRELAEALKRL